MTLLFIPCVYKSLCMFLRIIDSKQSEREKLIEYVVADLTFKESTFFIHPV